MTKETTGRPAGLTQACGLAARRPELPPPCADCRALDWIYESVDLRRCVACGYTVALPALDPQPRLVTLGDDDQLTWQSCRCDQMPDGQGCAACAALVAARQTATNRKDQESIRGHGSIQPLRRAGPP